MSRSSKILRFFTTVIWWVDACAIGSNTNPMALQLPWHTDFITSHASSKANGPHRPMEITDYILTVQNILRKRRDGHKEASRIRIVGLSIVKMGGRTEKRACHQ